MLGSSFFVMGKTWIVRPKTIPREECESHCKEACMRWKFWRRLLVEKACHKALLMGNFRGGPFKHLWH